MNELPKIIDLLKKDNSWDEISTKLGLLDYELLGLYHQILHGYGYDITKELEAVIKVDYLNHAIFKRLTTEKAIIISDLHLGSINENTAYLDQVKSFIVKEDIDILLNGGDIGDGMVRYHPKYNSYQKQVDHILNIYPSFNNLEQYLLGGNHDKRYKKKGQDILKLLTGETKSITGVGYYQAYFTIFDHLISFEHNSKLTRNNFLYPEFTIAGHAHKKEWGNEKVKIPPLSDSFPDKDQNILSGFLTLEAKRKKRLWSYYLTTTIVVKKR